MRLRLLISTALLAWTATVSSAQAAIVVGQSPPAGTPFPTSCVPAREEAQTGVSSGASYRVPEAGVITRWRTFGSPGDPGNSIAMRIYTVQDATHLTPVFESAPASLITGPMEFQTRFSVSGGELIGIRPTAGNSTCDYLTPSTADTYLLGNPPNPLGISSAYSPGDSVRLDVAAVLEPDADRDGFGDETQDQCPIQAATLGPCDTSGLVVRLSLHPKKKTKLRRALFAFESEPGATYQCALDKQAAAQCPNAKTYRKLKRRRHKLVVQAFNAHGDGGTPTVFRWRVVD